MFPSLYSIFVHQITISSDVQAPNLECGKIKDNLNESLLSVLDDKNLTICALKKQLENQKMQLAYYINKELKKETIQELSETCTPCILDTNLPLNLALSKFCKQAGIKSTLSLLHERMTRLDEDMMRRLRHQEFVLGQIVGKLADYARQQMSVNFGNFVMDLRVVDLFMKLLDSTAMLKRKLDCFRISCHRVLLIEEERNALADYVYSMPIEERTACNYLVGVGMEKAALENEIKLTGGDGVTVGSGAAAQPEVVEKILHNLRRELNSSCPKDEGNYICKMLKEINSEACVLLEMTKRQKSRLKREEDSTTKMPPDDRVALCVRAAFRIAGSHDGAPSSTWGLNNREEIRLFKIIRKEADVIRKLLRRDADEEITAAKKERRLLQEKIAQLRLENESASASNKALKQELKQVKKQRFIEKEKLKQERDDYKLQVEDLQVIREAYAQLVGQQPSLMQVEKEYVKQINEKERQILELEKLNNELSIQLKNNEETIGDQNQHIQMLSRFLYLVQPVLIKKHSSSATTTPESVYFDDLATNELLPKVTQKISETNKASSGVEGDGEQPKRSSTHLKVVRSSPSPHQEDHRPLQLDKTLSERTVIS
ncbi:uncharacterized protein LOC143198636 [Rhynchophorus ferrugineus]|uniref:uncharacterized protein LOC143198636 n=1 Tax=Rhynchophorus ferrugineus TaxID=354439 RepID=UPI003FCEA699